MTCITIVDWAKHYENNRTRELVRMAWVPMPNRMDGDGYTELLDHVNGSAHFGAWCALVEVASRCDVRGTLMRDPRTPHDEQSLARMTRIPVAVWKEALPRMATIGWIRLCEIPQEGAVIPQEGAPASHPVAIERNGTERNGREGGGTSPDTSLPPQKATPPDEDEEEPKMIPELMAIHRKATGAQLEIPGEEMTRLLALYRRHDGETLVAAYKLCQEEKPGKAMRFFLDDFPRYLAQARPQNTKPAPQLPKTCRECGTDYPSTWSQCPTCKEREEQAAALAARAGSPPREETPAPEPVIDDFEDDIPGEPAEKAELDIF